MPEEIKKEPEDIFAGEILPSSQKPITPPRLPEEFWSKTPTRSKGLSKKAIIVVIVFLVLAVGWLVYLFFFQGVKERISQLKNLGAGLVPHQPAPVDTDRDGLTDEKEKELGLNINSPDSDNDGLLDREEVEIYKTDPLNPDTDNDGLKDGEEVRQRLNPLDPAPGAKLFDLETEIKKLE